MGINSSMDTRQRKQREALECNFMQLRNGKIVGLNNATRSTLELFQPGGTLTVTDHGVYSKPHKPDLWPFGKKKSDSSISGQPGGESLTRESVKKANPHAPGSRTSLTKMNPSNALSGASTTSINPPNTVSGGSYTKMNTLIPVNKSGQGQGEQVQSTSSGAQSDYLATCAKNSEIFEEGANAARLEQLVNIQESTSFQAITEIHSEQCVERSECESLDLALTDLSDFRKNIPSSSTPLHVTDLKRNVVKLPKFLQQGKERVKLSYRKQCLREERLDNVISTSAMSGGNTISRSRRNVSEDFFEGLEQHAFIDLSKVAYEKALNRLSDTLKGEGSPSLVEGEEKATATFYSSSRSLKLEELRSLSLDNDFRAYQSCHHARWSELHHRRREWYLNRFTKAHRVYLIEEQTWIRRFFSVSTYLSTYLLLMITLLKRLYSSVSHGPRRGPSALLMISRVPRMLWCLCRGVIEKVFYFIVFVSLLTFHCVRTAYDYTVGYVIGKVITCPRSTVQVPKEGQRYSSLTGWMIDFLETKLCLLQGSSTKLKPFGSQSGFDQQKCYEVWRFCSVMGLILFTASIASFSAIYWSTFTQNAPAVKEMKIPRPEEVGLDNIQNIFLKFTSTRIPAWHVLPSPFSGQESVYAFRDGSPVFLHLRNTAVMTSAHRIQVYDTLSSLGYHVLVPVFQLSVKDAKLAWKWLRNRTNASNVFLWGDNLETSEVTALAKDLCKEGVPPAGVVIEVEAPKTNPKFTTLEVWSCNCTTAKNNEPESYGYVKCPLPHNNPQSIDELYVSISRCLNTIMEK